MCGIEILEITTLHLLIMYGSVDDLFKLGGKMAIKNTSNLFIIILRTIVLLYGYTSTQIITA